MVIVKHQVPAFTAAEAGRIAELFGVSGPATLAALLYGSEVGRRTRVARK